MKTFVYLNITVSHLAALSLRESSSPSLVVLCIFLTVPCTLSLHFFCSFAPSVAMSGVVSCDLPFEEPAHAINNHNARYIYVSNYRSQSECYGNRPVIYTV